MAIFPPSPNPGDQISDPATGAVWRWSGPPANRWDAVAAGRGGVTDGSEAGAGMVGEYLEFSTDVAVSMATQQTWVSVGSLALGPGDWDVTTQCQIYSTTNNLQTDIVVPPEPIGTGTTQFYRTFLVLAPGVHWATPTVNTRRRILLGAPAIIHSYCWAGAPAYTGLQSIQARRFR
jgi:hypothetical protein